MAFFKKNEYSHNYYFLGIKLISYLHLPFIILLVVLLVCF